MYARTEPVGAWFMEWMKYHQFLHGSKYWIDPDSDDAPKFYQGWIEAFSRWGVAKDDAHRVSRLLQAHKGPSPDRHLDWFKDQYFEMRKADRLRSGQPATAGVSAEEQVAAERSARCPECDPCDGTGPTGFARRRMEVKGFPWSLFVDLYCRCPLGRHRERTTVVEHEGRTVLDRELGEARHISDLRLHQELWDGTLAHASWDYSEPDEQAAHQADATWRYLTPREAEAYRQPSLAALKGLVTSAREVIRERPKFIPYDPPPSPAPVPDDGADELIAFSPRATEESP